MCKLSKKTFILGAGFSKEAGLPIANELVCFIKNYLHASRDTRDIDFKKEFYDFITGLNPSLFLNVELLLTYIDLALLNNSVQIFTSFASSEDLRLFRMKLSGDLVRAFDDAHFELARKNQNIKIYQDFCKKLNKGDTIITFNYDLIAEQGLWEQGKWTFLDGYGFTKNMYDFQDDNLKYPSDKPTESLVKVYKLHGSLGWIYNEEAEEVILGGMPDYFSGYTGIYCERNLYSAEARWDMGTTFIEPSYIKRFNCVHVLDIWKQAFLALQPCNELIIIGYGLSEADTAAHAFLTSWVYTSQITSITVINPDSSVFGRFEMIFGKPIIKKKMTFKEWIEKEVENR